MLVSVYFGVQAPQLTREDELRFFGDMARWLDVDHGTGTFETMRFIDEAGWTNAVVVAYWTDPTGYEAWRETSGFQAWFHSPERLQGDLGYWCEPICVPYERHETIYSAMGYRIGFGRCPGTEVVPITTNGYFGAARDRLPLSAIDPLLSPTGDRLPGPRDGDTRGQLWVARAPHNATFLRSGQFWEGAGPEQLNDYLEQLQPKLMRGMAYLREAPAETGCLSLRVMTNVGADGAPRAETSVGALFTSLAPLERWAEGHETHAEIYRHAIAMNRLYKQRREVITWHELFVLQRGHLFEYANCHGKTGLLAYDRYAVAIAVQ